MAARKNTPSKSDQIRTLLASGLAPGAIAKKVGSSRNLVYLVKAKQDGTKKGKTRRKTAPKARPAGRTTSGNKRSSSGNKDVVEQFLASLKELERERDELHGVVDKIRQIVNGLD